MKKNKAGKDKTGKKLILRRVFCAVLAFAFLGMLLLPLMAYAADEMRVFDDAMLFTDGEASALNTKAIDYGDELGLKLGIATTNDTGGKSTLLYSGDFFEENPWLGNGQNGNGLLLTIDMDAREVVVTTHGEAHSLFADEDIEYVLDKVAPQLSAGNFAKAADAFLEEAYNSTILLRQGYIPARGQAPPQPVPVIKLLGRSFLVALGISAIVVLIMYGIQRGSLSKAPGGQKYMVAGVNITRQVDQFLTTHTAIVPKPKNDNNNSGGFGGGSRSTGSFTSSGGGSFGGGGRKF